MVSLDRISLDFGEVRYDQRVTLPIVITNTGQVVAQFRLVPKVDEVRVYVDSTMVVSYYLHIFTSHQFVLYILMFRLIYASNG